ncbi:MAG: hypothetical protein DRJ30_02500 [Candidatus Methanomethylicota archaeon]|nr:MAG: hypothetical protein DRJ30_02500 [Candidatus Verstraetearchaeota archaeon]
MIICNSGVSNTGTLTGLAAFDVVKKLGEENIEIYSLPTLVNKIPRQSMIIKKIERLIIVDGCHSKCAKKILDSLGIKYAGYLNLEYVLKIKTWTFHNI